MAINRAYQTWELSLRNWRVWVVLGKNKPLFQAERSSCKRCYLFHVPYVSVAFVDWEAL